jgi:hypothetical protein
MAVFDTTGGTDPSATVLPFGNNFLVADDANSSVSGLHDFLFFNFAQATQPAPGEIIIPATVSIDPPGSTPDPILATLLGGPVAFRFNNPTFFDLGNGDAILQWQLAGVSAVPEPASFLLMGAGLVALAGTRIRRLAGKKA